MSLPKSFYLNEEPSFETHYFIVCAYYSVNTLDEIIENVLTGFESKEGIASSFQEIIEGERRDIELYILGQITPSYLEAYMPLPEEMALFQDLIDALFAETFHFSVGAQIIEEAVDPGNGNIFDLTHALDISAPRFSSDCDIGAMAVLRPNKTDTMPFIKLAVNIDQFTTEFMLLYMYLNTITQMNISGGMIPTSEDLQITLPDYSTPSVDIEKTCQTSRGMEMVTVTITNNGLSNITDLELNDPFPEKYGVLSSGSTRASWIRLRPRESISISYEVQYVSPGTYTNMPAVLKYREDGKPCIAVSNIPPATSKNPNGLTLLAENYKATIGIINLLTGRGDLFGLIPLAIFAVIAAVDAFKIFKNRFKSDLHE